MLSVGYVFRDLERSFEVLNAILQFDCLLYLYLAGFSDSKYSKIKPHKAVLAWVMISDWMRMRPELFEDCHVLLMLRFNV